MKPVKAVILILAQLGLATQLGLASPVARAAELMADAKSPQALMTEVLKKVAEAHLFDGPEGRERFERAVGKAFDARAIRMRKLLEESSDDQLREKVSRMLEHAKKAGSSVLLVQLEDLLARPEGIRKALEAKLDPTLREDAIERAGRAFEKTGDVRGAVESLIADQCPPYGLDSVSEYIAFLGLLYWGLENGPAVDWIWGGPLLVAAAAVGIPVLFVVDILIGFPVWFFADYLPCVNP